MTDKLPATAAEALEEAAKICDARCGNDPRSYYQLGVSLAHAQKIADDEAYACAGDIRALAARVREQNAAEQAPETARTGRAAEVDLPPSDLGLESTTSAGCLPASAAPSARAELTNEQVKAYCDRYRHVVRQDEDAATLIRKVWRDAQEALRSPGAAQPQIPEGIAAIVKAAMELADYARGKSMIHCTEGNVVRAVEEFFGMPAPEELEPKGNDSEKDGAG